MKKNLYFVLILLFPILLGLGSCSSSDDDWIDLNSEEIIGTWSTGTEGVHKYLKFENDGTGYYALLNGADFATNYWLSLKTWGIALKFLFLHHENILFSND